MVRVFKPKMIICGSSAYPRDFDYKRFREIDINNSYLLCDMAHISGNEQPKIKVHLITVVVTSTTHKTHGEVHDQD